MSDSDQRLRAWMCARFGARVMLRSLNVWALARFAEGTPEALACAS